MANIKALEQLRRVVSEIPAADLNVGGWCGCIGGTAAKDAWFQAHGMGMGGGGGNYAVPAYNGKTGFGAYADFLGVHDDQVIDLMSSSGYKSNSGHPTHDLVFTKIDGLIAKARAAEPEIAAVPALELEDA